MTAQARGYMLGADMVAPIDDVGRLVMESCEHVAVGNAIQLKATDGSTAAANVTPLPVGNRTLLYGQVVA